ncbi:hypothetical protein [Pontibacter chinhatensis]|uniref:Uncharacterized protein n=1 Tax=Pontibacter chinhatensis TaxID=1436961 RepID=A0A1I2RXD6_9BACT|nr:hypothetical protein [Pontibacter chinhatensis]SFG45140.1 hypothetical protein SAMN05421739_102568 [Pontibacter chinhatensis]
MREEKLSSTDRSKVWLELKQLLISYVLVGIVALMVAVAVVLFLSMEQQPRIIILSAVLVFVAGFLGFLYYSTKNHLKDLIAGVKYTYDAHITAKESNTNWGWHGNPAADAAAQPQLSMYTLSIGEHKINVGEEMYNSVCVGEKVWVQITPHSKLILDLHHEPLQV